MAKYKSFDDVPWDTPEKIDIDELAELTKEEMWKLAVKRFREK